MNKKITKKVLTVAALLAVIMTPSFANAASGLTSYGISSMWSSYTKPSIPITSKWYSNTSVISQANNMFNNIVDYKEALEDVSEIVDGLDTNQSAPTMQKDLMSQLSGLLNGDYSNSPSASTAISKIQNILMNLNATSSDDLITTIKNVLQSMMSSLNLGIESLVPDVILDGDSRIDASTAGSKAGDEYNVKLSAKIYYSGIKNGKPTSDKWVLLVHPNSTNGQAIADAVGQMYLDQGINIIAPDLRGFGNSEGSNAMGYLESLDVWDWLTYLNSNYNCSEIFVHGVSLGGATTVFLSGLSVDGKTLKDQNVIGLVEDCGYASMTGIIKGLLGGSSSDSSESSESVDSGLVAQKLGIADKTDLSSLVGNLGDTVIKELLINTLGTGLTDSNFDELQNGLNSLEKCELPILIIHGTSDSMVSYENSDLIYNTAMANDKIPYVQRFTADGEQHAFILFGSKYNPYEDHVKYFVNQAEKVANNESVEKVQEVTVRDEETSIINNLVRALKLIKNLL